MDASRIPQDLSILYQNVQDQEELIRDPAQEEANRLALRELEAQFGDAAMTKAIANLKKKKFKKLEKDIGTVVQKKADHLFGKKTGVKGTKAKEEFIKNATKALMDEAIRFELVDPDEMLKELGTTLIYDTIIDLVEKNPDQVHAPKSLPLMDDLFRNEPIHEIKKTIKDGKIQLEIDFYNSAGEKNTIVLKKLKPKDFEKLKPEDLARISTRASLYIRHRDNPEVVDQLMKRTGDALVGAIMGVVSAIEPHGSVVDRYVSPLQKLGSNINKDQAMTPAADAHHHQIVHATEVQHSIEQAAIGISSVGMGFGVFKVATGLKGLMNLWKEGKTEEFYRMHKQYLKEIKDLDERDRPSEATLQNLQAISDTITANYARKSFGSTMNVLSGTASIIGASGTFAQMSILAASATGVSGGLIIVAGFSEAALAAMDIYKKVNLKKEVKTIRKELDEDLKGSSTEKRELVQRFLDLQLKMIRTKQLNNILRFSKGTAMVAGGALLVAASVAGAATVGIGAAAVLGGTVLAVGGIEIGKKLHNRKVRKLDDRAFQEDLQRYAEAKKAGVDKEERFAKMRSSVGVALAVYQVVKEELFEKAQAQERITAGSEELPPPAPLTNRLISQYFKLDPEMFCKSMEEIEQKFIEKATKRAGMTTTEMEEAEEENVPAAEEEIIPAAEAVIVERTLG